MAKCASKAKKKPAPPSLSTTPTDVVQAELWKERAKSEHQLNMQLIGKINSIEEGTRMAMDRADRAMKAVDDTQSTLKGQKEKLESLEKDYAEEKKQRLLLEAENRLLRQELEKCTVTKKSDAGDMLEKLKTKYGATLKENMEYKTTLAEQKIDLEETKKKLEAADEGNQAAMEQYKIEHEAAMRVLEAEMTQQNIKLLGDVVRITASAHQQKCNMESAFKQEKSALRAQLLVFAAVLSLFATGLLVSFGPSCLNFLTEYVRNRFTTSLNSIWQNIMQFGYATSHQNDLPTSIDSLVSISAFTRLESVLAPTCHETFSVAPDVVFEPIKNCGLDVTCWITKGCEWLDMFCRFYKLG